MFPSQLLHENYNEQAEEGGEKEKIAHD